MTAQAARLEAIGVSKRFGGLRALHEVSFSIPPGEVLAIIGPNGAGKSTLINCLSSAVARDAGSVRIDGVELPREYADRLVGLGITRTFQQVRLFPSLTVLEHLLLTRRAWERTARATGSAPAQEVCLSLLERVGLSDRRDRMPMELAYGERRRLEIARGLATEPLVFLVDELAAGSTGAEQLGLAALIRHIAGTGAAVLLVEHHMDLISRVADRVLVLNFGETVTSGSYDEVRRDPRVVAAYLGAQEA